MEEISDLLQAITALEAQRGSIDNQEVDAALVPLEEKLAVLEQDQPANRQRRMVTVMFMDIINSTLLSQGFEPEELQESIGWALKKLAEPVEKHGGRVAQVMGDGYMAVFGLARTLENDVEQAIRGGLEVLEVKRACAAELEARYGMRDFDIRIGINTGRVVVGQTNKHESPVMGLTVSLAARMEENAMPGSLLISQFTQQHVRGVFEFEVVPPVEAKGFPAPIPAYKVVSAKPSTFQMFTRGVDGMETSMVGREEELNQLRDAILHCSNHRACQLITIMGEAGVGKSRLLFEFDRWMANSEIKVTTFRARALQEKMTMPYSLLREMISNHIGRKSTDMAVFDLQHLEQAFTANLDEEPEMKAHFVGVLIGLPVAKSPYLAGVLNDPKQLKERAESYLIQYISSTANRTTVVILLDDIHWGDGPSLSFIKRLISARLNIPMLVICFARPGIFERYPTWTQKEEEFLSERAAGSISSKEEVLTLKPLSRQESILLLAEMLKNIEILPTGIRKQILDQADGNPFFLEEYVQTLIDKQALYKSSQEAGWEVDEARLRKLELPATLIALLEARLDSLSTSQRILIQQAAVLGQVFWRSGLQALRGERIVLEKDIDALSRRGFIYLRGRSVLDESEEYAFQHGLLRETAYEQMFKSDRKMYHRKAADWLVEVMNDAGRKGELAAIIAEHYEAADEFILAADWFIQSGRGARNQGAPSQSLEFYERALNHLQRQETETGAKIDLHRYWEALSGRNEVLGILGETERRMTDDNALVELAHQIGDDHLLAEAYYRQGYSNELRGQYLVAVEAYDRGLVAAGKVNDLRREALLLGLKVVCLTRLGVLNAALDAAKLALKYAQECHDDLVLTRNLNNVSFLYTEAGDLAKAAQLLNQQLMINQRTGNREDEMVGLANLGYIYILIGMPEEGVSRLQKCIEMAQSVSHREFRASICLNLALAHMRSGDHISAAAKLDQCMPELLSMNNQFSLAVGNTYSAMLKEQTGQINEALAGYKQAGLNLLQIGTPGYAYDAIAGEARCKLLLGDVRGAEEAAELVWKYLMQGIKTGMEFPLLGFETCAEVYTAAGKDTLARNIIDLGYQELMGRAEKISLANWRQSFLERIPEHQRIINKWYEFNPI